MDGQPKRHAGKAWDCEGCGMRYKPLLPRGEKLLCPECYKSGGNAGDAVPVNIDGPIADSRRAGNTSVPPLVQEDMFDVR